MDIESKLPMMPDNWDDIDTYLDNELFLRSLLIGSSSKALAAFATFLPLNTGDRSNPLILPANFIEEK